MISLKCHISWSPPPPVKPPPTRCVVSAASFRAGLQRTGWEHPCDQALRAAMDHSCWRVPSGKHTKNYGKSLFSMGKLTINHHFQQLFWHNQRVSTFLNLWYRDVIICHDISRSSISILFYIYFSLCDSMSILSYLPISTHLHIYRSSYLFISPIAFFIVCLKKCGRCSVLNTNLMCRLCMPPGDVIF